MPSQTSMICLIDPDSVVPAGHPIRSIKKLADGALKQLSNDFDRVYHSNGRHSIPPERLLKGMLLMALFSIKSERALCEQLHYNLLFKWFVDMEMTEKVFDPSVFSHNRERFLSAELTARFFDEVVAEAQRKQLMSRDHFSVDGTMIEAWASMSSFQKKDDSNDDEPKPPVNKKKGWRGKGKSFRGQRRRNQTHASKTDPEAKLYRKGTGQEARMCFLGHVLTENRNGLIVNLDLTMATGTAEREAAIRMLDEASPELRQRTLAADAGYNTRGFVEECRSRYITPHVAVKKHSAVDGRTTRQPGYEVSQTLRRIAEGVNGWLKAPGRMAKTRFRGVARSKAAFFVYGAALNLLRMAKLLQPV